MDSHQSPRSQGAQCSLLEAAYGGAEHSPVEEGRWEVGVERVKSAQRLQTHRNSQCQLPESPLEGC